MAEGGEPPRELRIRLLGPLEVEGVAPQAFGSRKARTLLRALALARGRPVDTDRLVEVCWGDDPPARPADQVSVLASRLRRAVGRDRLDHGDGGYRLQVDWLDLDEVEALADEAARRLDAGSHAAARAAVGAALAHVRGPLLADESDAPWAEVERAAADRLVARLRHLAAEAALSMGDAVDAAEAAEAALAHDPYDEHALRLLMVAWRAAGRPASALAAYARIRARLAEDLGVDPSPETEAVHTAVLREEEIPDIVVESPRPAAAAATSPVDASVSFPGREKELEALDAALRRVAGGSAEVVLVDGEAGIGKTVLLAAWAARARQRGAVVLAAASEEYERSLPLQVVVDAVESHLRAIDRQEAEAALGPERAVLAPLLAGWEDERGTAPPLGVLADRGPAPLQIFRALAAVLSRLSPGAPLVLVLDDMHSAGPMTAEWVRFATRPGGVERLLVVAARRVGEGSDLPATETLVLGPLDREAAAMIVGSDRADELHARSGGNPLFLVELAAAEPGDELPASILDAVSARCDAAGDAALTLRTAAVVGPEVDLDLLSAVMQRRPIDVLDDLEEGVRLRFFDERGATFVFRHELVRQALAVGVSATRAALVHREAGRALAARPDPDAPEIAYHARLGGDEKTAADALVQVAVLAAERADYRAAEEILDQSLALAETVSGRLRRAQVKALRGRHVEAVDDAEAALAEGAGSAALEVAGWASYWDRDFTAAQQFADDGVRIATDTATRASCLTLAGRTRHASGDLDGAESRFVEAIGLADGPALVAASAWLGVLRSHQSRAAEALDLLRSATRAGSELGEVNVFLHALLFTGHAAALAGRPAEALAALESYAAEVQRREVHRFAGRAENFGGWILRSLGRWSEADDRNAAALEVGRTPGNIPETPCAASLDLAEGCLFRGDLDGAARHLADAEAGIGGVKVFGWRQSLKLRSHRARLALAGGEWEEAERLGYSVAEEATVIGVPRYAVTARLLVARARAAAGYEVDREAVEADLAALPRVVCLEAWWWTAEAARDVGVDRWWSLAEDRVDELATQAGPHDGAFRRHARERLDAFRG